MKSRRAGEPAAPTPLRAHRQVEPSGRIVPEPARLGSLSALVDAIRQNPAAWRSVWADELRAKGEIP